MCGEIAGGESEVAQCLGPTIVSERANELVGVGLVGAKREGGRHSSSISFHFQVQLLDRIFLHPALVVQ